METTCFSTRGHTLLALAATGGASTRTSALKTRRRPKSPSGSH